MADKKSKEILAQEFYDVLLDSYDGQPPLNQAQLLSTISKPEASYYYLVTDGQDKANSFIVYQRTGDEFELEYLAVKKAYRRQGRATKLIATMLSKARNRPIYLEVRASNHGAQSLYERTGFKKISVRKDYYHNPTEDAILMKHEGYHGR